MKAYRQDSKLVLDAVDGPWHVSHLQCHQATFNDPRVRKAVAHAIKREKSSRRLLGRGSGLAHLPIPKGERVLQSRARERLGLRSGAGQEIAVEAGHPNGFSCSLLSTAQYGMHKRRPRSCSRTSRRSASRRAQSAGLGDRVTVGNKASMISA